MPVEHLLRTVTRWGMDFIYPRSCRWCCRLLPDESDRGERFCDPCRQAIAPPVLDRCSRCSAPVGPHLETSQGCIHCRRHVWHYQQAISLGPYSAELRHACLSCKRSRHSALTAALARLLCQQHGDLLRSWNCDLIVPVPHYWMDRIWRDHASTIIAEQLSRELNLPVMRHCLLKRRHTRKQQELSASRRESNLQNAFRISGPRILQGKRILLADDILTTGITADRCTRMLLQAGAREVNVAVLARSIGG